MTVRVFIGSSKEQKQLVEWLTAFMRAEYANELEPVPWYLPWPGSRYTLDNLQRLVDDTDAAILFWTADDKTWYRDTERHEPRDNLVFEAGLFMSAQGRERTQLMIPRYPPGDKRGTVATPSDVTGLAWNLFDWADGPPEATGLPNTARTVCNNLRLLRLRPRTPLALRHLTNRENVEEVRTYVGEWATMHIDGIAHLAKNPDAKAIDVLSVYRVGEIRRQLDAFRQREHAHLRACFANMFDEELLAAYRRKYHDRTPDHVHSAVKESITLLLGPCKIEFAGGQLRVTDVQNPPKAKYEIRLTNQRITYSFYRIDAVAFLVPLDMKRDQNPAPLAWALARETAPRTFDCYVSEFDRMFAESARVFPSP